MFYFLALTLSVRVPYSSAASTEVLLIPYNFQSAPGQISWGNVTLNGTLA